MKTYVTVKVRVEFSASDIRTFTEQVSSPCPVSQAIANVKYKLKEEMGANAYLLNYWAE